MKFRNQFLKYKLFANTGEGGGGGGNAHSIDDLTKQIAAMQESVGKLENKNKELLGENRNLKEGLKSWEGLDPKNIRNLMDKINNDEELKLITEGKHDEVIKRRTEKLEAGYQAQLRTKEEEANKYKSEFEKANSKVTELLIDSSITQEFVKAKGEDFAIPDILHRAKSVWTIENGEAVPRDKNGNILQGKNGVMTQSEWIDSLRTTAPHLFPASTGAGAGGNRNSGANSIDDKIAAARKAGDFDEVRRLRSVKSKNA